MKNLVCMTVAAALLLSSAGMATAQPYDGQRQEHRNEHRNEQERPQERHYQQVDRHDGWQRGGEMRHDDWERGGRVDYREYQLREPPRGYEWREVDGVFVLGAIATGIIADILLNQR